MANEDTGVTFSNGLSPEQQMELLDLEVEISSIAVKIDALGRHRSYSLAVTKLDEARHWLRDRQNRAA